MGAPSASLSLEYDVDISGAIIAPRARVGITYADTGAGVGRELLPTALLELRAGPQRLGGVFRLGAVRAPVHLRRLSAAPDGPAQTVYRDWFWRRTAELASNCAYRSPPLDHQPLTAISRPAQSIEVYPQVQTPQYAIAAGVWTSDGLRAAPVRKLDKMRR
jgi:hypothetical protein